MDLSLTLRAEQRQRHRGGKADKTKVETEKMIVGIVTECRGGGAGREERKGIHHVWDTLPNVLGVEVRSVCRFNHTSLCSELPFVLFRLP